MRNDYFGVQFWELENRIGTLKQSPYNKLKSSYQKTYHFTFDRFLRKVGYLLRNSAMTISYTYDFVKGLDRLPAGEYSLTIEGM